MEYEEYKRLVKEIDDHFNNITTEQLENNLEKAGMDVIKSCREDGYILKPIVDCYGLECCNCGLLNKAHLDIVNNQVVVFCPYCKQKVWGA